ncbi:MAG: NUDIX domain-containing protein [Candidatus Aenigmatarchaeota archaeon]
MINQRIMATAVIKRGNKYLMVRRSRYSKTYPNQWQFPEGGVKFGEEPLQALKRELNEETKLKIRNAKLLGINSSTIKYFNKRIYHFVRLLYSCKASGKIKLSRKHNDYNWFTKKEIKSLRLLKGFGYKDIEKLL